MSQTFTQKATIFTFVLTALFVLALALPTGADAKTRAERAKEKRDAKMASSTKERSERERSPYSSSTRPERTASSTDNRGKNVDATCMQAAIDTREASLVSGWDKFSASMKSALAARKTSLYTAWGMSDVSARNTALKESWKTARAATKSAHTTLKSDRKAAWDTFKTTAKNTCKASVPKEESLDKDSSGSISL